MEIHLGDTRLILEEALLSGEQLFVCQAVIGGLQGAENERSHYEVQHDPHQQGKEGGAPHLLPAEPPGLGARVRRPGSQSGCGAQLAVNRSSVERGALRERAEMC